MAATARCHHEARDIVESDKKVMSQATKSSPGKDIFRSTNEFYREGVRLLLQKEGPLHEDDVKDETKEKEKVEDLDLSFDASPTAISTADTDPETAEETEEAEEDGEDEDEAEA